MEHLELSYLKTNHIHPAWFLSFALGWEDFEILLCWFLISNKFNNVYSLPLMYVNHAPSIPNWQETTVRFFSLQIIMECFWTQNIERYIDTFFLFQLKYYLVQLYRWFTPNQYNICAWSVQIMGYLAFLTAAVVSFATLASINLTFMAQ